jgi:hypothetical protein
MPELKSMTAVKMLEDLRKILDAHRDIAIGKINILSVDDNTFDGIDTLLNGYALATSKALRITRILKKEG